MRTSLALSFLLPLAATTAQAADRFDSSTVSGLGIRNIGSAQMSGRVAAIDGRVDGGRTTLFVGAASGGVWKSIDDGTTFKPVFDHEAVQSIGAITIDPKNPKIVWVGTGEPWTRNSVSVGNGVYRSVDGGETWTHMGLAESERISKILVDPRNSDSVYVCVPGKLWSDSADRGLYHSADGGKTWLLMLKGANLSTGCSSIAMDPKNPDLIYAGLWDFRRKGWTFRSGGDGPTATSGSALFRSADGGKSWQEVTDKNTKGIPAKPWGRVAVAIAPSNNQIVYTFIESTRSALFRSDDAGKTFEERDRSQMMVWRPFYFAQLFIDPVNPDKIFKPDLGLIVSTDGGKSFSGAGGGTHGDHHAMFIDPVNPNHIYTGDDGGLWQSFDGGNRWWKQNNLPISQFYHVSVDELDPYKVYGGLQDNSSWVGDSAYPGGISNHRWENMYGGDGFWMFSDPADPNYLYAESQGGNIGRVNRNTHEVRDIQPKAGYQEKLRFNWNTPIHLSPNEKGTLYIGAQFLFRSRDHGDSWQRISPDLTTNDKQKQRQEESGGVTVDNSSAEMHTTIYSISESPKDGRTLWVGTDDGNIQLTRDGGEHWTNLVGNIKGMPANSWVSWIEASRHDAATAYVAFDRHTFGDMTPYVFKTSDFGKTWTRIVSPAQGVRGYAHVVKEDSVRGDILFLGTEFGLWMSIDGGARWAEFKGENFPAAAVRDIVVQCRENDLVIATHGRGIWIIDDITPLRGLTPAVLNGEAGFLAARPVQQRISAFGGWPDGDAVYEGTNPAGGAQITYFQKSRHLIGRMKIEVLDSTGKVIDVIPASKRPGINRVSWSMRAKPPRVPPAAQLAFAGTQGPRMPPGEYRIRMTKGDKVYETPLVIGVDRRATYSAADRQAQYDAAMKAHALFGRMSGLVDRVVAVREQATARAAKLPEKDALRAALKGAADGADAIRRKIVASKEGGAITGEERLREHLDQAYGSLTGYDGRPTGYQVERVAVLERELADVEKEFETFLAKDLAAVNKKLGAAKQEPIVAPPVKPVAENPLSSGDAESVLARWARGSLAGAGMPTIEASFERD